MRHGLQCLVPRKKKQHQLYGCIEILKQAKLEILSQNRKDLQTQVARIKETIAKVLDKDTYLAERIGILFREQSIAIMAVLTALSVTI